MPSIFLLAFWLLLSGALVVSWRAGDRQDRKCVAAIVLATICSAAATALPNLQAAILTVCFVDAALLVFVVRYALVSQRYWPLWFAGFHGATLVLIICAALLSGEQQLVSWRLGSFWSLPALYAMVAGLLLDKRAGVANAISREAQR